MSFAADSIQCALYTPAGAIVDDAATVFQKIFVQQPDATQRASGPMGQSTAQGPHGNYAITVTTQPGRLDIYVNPPPTESSTPQPMADAAAALDKGIASLQTACGHYTSSRLAVLQNLVEVVPNPTAGLSRLSEILPDIPIKGEAADFVWQTNVKKSFQYEASRLMNRIVKYAGATQQFLRFSLAPGSLAQSPFLIDVRQVILLVVDVNSDTLSGEALGKQDAEQMLAELAEEARSLLSEVQTRAGSHG